MTFERFFPYGQQTIDDDDVAAITQALKADYLTTGPMVEEYETAFANAVGARCAIACNSGTAALHLAVMALDLGPGDVAIVPTVTFLATANVVRMCGADIVFADVDPDTGLMTPETFSEALMRVPDGLSAKIVLPVHLNGQFCDMQGLAAIAEPRGIKIIEDACHALGAENAGATKFSTIACFSTHPVKAIATGEGGAVVCNDEDLARRMKSLRSHGLTRDAQAFKNVDEAFDGDNVNPWYYEMHEIGWNYRMPDLLCALGVSQLSKLPNFYKRRCEIAALYDELFVPLAPLVRPVPKTGSGHGHHLYVLLIDFDALGVSRRLVIEQLRSDGIGCQVHYQPVHRQPYYQELYGALHLLGANAYYDKCLSVPIFPNLTPEQQALVSKGVAKVLQ